MKSGGGRRTCYRVLHDRTAGVATLKRAATPARPTSSVGQGFVDRRVVREIVLIKVKSITEFRHVFYPVRRFRIAVSFFEAKTVQDDVNPAAEPAAGGLARVLPNACLAR